MFCFSNYNSILIIVRVNFFTILYILLLTIGLGGDKMDKENKILFTFFIIFTLMIGIPILLLQLYIMDINNTYSNNELIILAVILSVVFSISDIIMMYVLFSR